MRKLMPFLLLMMITSYAWSGIRERKELCLDLMAHSRLDGYYLTCSPTEPDGKILTIEFQNNRILQYVMAGLPDVQRAWGKNGGTDIKLVLNSIYGPQVLQTIAVPAVWLVPDPVRKTKAKARAKATVSFN